MNKFNIPKSKYILKNFFAWLICVSMILSCFSFNISADEELDVDVQVAEEKESNTIDQYQIEPDSEVIVPDQNDSDNEETDQENSDNEETDQDEPDGELNDSYQIEPDSVVIDPDQVIVDGELTDLVLSDEMMNLLLYEYPIMVMDEGFSVLVTAENAGNLELQLPSTGSTYTVEFHILRKYDDGNYIYGMSDEIYYVEIIDILGEVNTELSGNYRFAYTYNSLHEHPELAVEIEGVAAGSTVTIYNIQVEKIEYDNWGGLLWNNYSYTAVESYIYDEEDSSNLIILNEDNPLQLVVGQTKQHTTYTEDTDHNRPTNDDFTDQGGSYSLLYFLNNYNVVSLDDIESTHIVGPILAQNNARRTTEEPEINGILSYSTGYLAASDYSRSIASYVGILSSFDDDNTQSGLQLNYTYDRLYETSSNPFTAPYFYTELEDVEIIQTVDSNHVVDYISLTDGSYFLSPNDHGAQLTYQNDDFIDFDLLEETLIYGSEEILLYGNAEGAMSEEIYYIDFEDETLFMNDTELDFDDYVYETETGNYGLTIGAEQSWTITNADGLEAVNIILPDDYDYYDNPYLFPTTINFSCAYINPIEIDGVTHSQLPYTLVDGEEFESTLGENGEFGEVGNKIIWNMPNLVTTSSGENKLITVGNGQNIAGHIIAPNAEFWNYEYNESSDTYSWEGGNINGCVIVKSFYSGVAEMHMWPYDGKAEQSVIYGVEALKTVNGELPDRSYEFELSPVLVDGEIPDGILNTSFPMVGESRVDDGDDTGLIKFTSLAFAKEGTYSFIIQEIPSSSLATDNVTYDLTEYQINITVEIDEFNSDDDLIVYEITDIEKYQLTDRYGVSLESPLLLESDSGELVFTFDNWTDTDFVNVNFLKLCTTGHVLEGAKFYVTEMTSATDETLPYGGYFEKVTSQSDGSVSITGLEKEVYYKFWEYESAAGHTKATGYWILYIGPTGFLYITPMDGAQEITDNIIYNEPETSSYLDIVLTKENQMNSTLEDVEFRVQLVVINSEGIPEDVIGGFDTTYFTESDGTFNIYHLQANNIYMITEESTPFYHIEHTGYWLISVTGDVLSPSAALTYTITEYDEFNNVVSEIVNDTLMNEKIEYKLPNTGSYGIYGFYLAGAIILVANFSLYRKFGNKKAEE